MFEDFKEKVREFYLKNKCLLEAEQLPPQILEHLRNKGIDPENFTLSELWPEVLTQDGLDITLMSASEIETLSAFDALHEYFIKAYPQTQREAWDLGQAWEEEPDAKYQINVIKAREDPKARVYLELMEKLVAICDKISILQRQASKYEKICIRLYRQTSHKNINNQCIEGYQPIIEDSTMFEIVEAYFRICKKYHVPTFEEPYYFLSKKRKLEVKLEGDRIKRETDYIDDDIYISILEDTPVE